MVAKFGIHSNSNHSTLSFHTKCRELILTHPLVCRNDYFPGTRKPRIKLRAGGPIVLLISIKLLRGEVKLVHCQRIKTVLQNAFLFCTTIDMTVFVGKYNQQTMGIQTLQSKNSIILMKTQKSREMCGKMLKQRLVLKRILCKCMAAHYSSHTNRFL